MTLEQRNALYCGLNHHILPKRVDELQLKCNIENTMAKILDKCNVQTDTDLRDEIKIIMNSFLKTASNVCSSRYNKVIHKTLRNLSKNENTKIC